MSHRGVISLKQKLGLTHFLRVPLATGKSYPRVKEAYDQLKQDPLFQIIPKDALHHVDNLHLVLGSLRLNGPKHVDAACSLLRDLEQGGWHQLSEAFKNETSGAGDRITTLSQTEIQPFMVDLVGVGGCIDPRTRNTDLSRTPRLYSHIQNSTVALYPFFKAISERFYSKGLGRMSEGTSHVERQQIALANTNQSPPYTTKNPHPKLAPHQQQYLRQRIDAREIQEKYRDVPWIKSIPLQEIRISEIGRPRKADGTLLQHAFNDVATFKLPGSYETSPKQEDIDA